MRSDAAASILTFLAQPKVGKMRVKATRQARALAKALAGKKNSSARYRKLAQRLKTSAARDANSYLALVKKKRA